MRRNKSFHYNRIIRDLKGLIDGGEISNVIIMREEKRARRALWEAKSFRVEPTVDPYQTHLRHLSWSFAVFSIWIRRQFIALPNNSFPIRCLPIEASHAVQADELWN